MNRSTSPAQVQSRFPRLLRRVALAAMLVAPLFAAGCRSAFPGHQVPRMRWLVLPLEQPPAMADTPIAIRGWWLGARTIRQNPRAGAELADVISRAFDKELPFVNQFSQVDLRYYFADKRERLRQAYAHLEDPEVERLIAQVPPIDYARELGADKMLTGRILRDYMGEHRTIHWWWSVVEAEISVVDVRTGTIEWTGHYSIDDTFGSMLAAEEELARQLVDDLREQYFRPLITP